MSEAKSALLKQQDLLESAMRVLEVMVISSADCKADETIPSELLYQLTRSLIDQLHEVKKLSLTASKSL